MVVVSDFYGGGDAIPMVNYLTIKTDQNDAMIFIDDEFAGLKDVSKLLSVGKNHSWRIECDMYHTESGKVTLTQGEPTILEKKLIMILFLFKKSHYLKVTAETEQ